MSAFDSKRTLAGQETGISRYAGNGWCLQSTGVSELPAGNS
jgi:NIPSNAP